MVNEDVGGHMYVQGRIRFPAEPLSSGRRSAPQQAARPPVPEDSDDDDALRPALGVVIGVIIGGLCWLALVLALRKLGIL